MKRRTLLKQAFNEFSQGNFWASDRFRRHYPFLMFLALLAVLSIYSSYKADLKTHEVAKLRKQLEAVHGEYLETRSELMEASAQSEVMLRAQNLGLKHKDQPPYLLPKVP